MSSAPHPLRPLAGDARAQACAAELASLLSRAGVVAQLIEALCERPQLLRLGVAAAALADELGPANLHLLAVEAELRAILAGDRR